MSQRQLLTHWLFFTFDIVRLHTLTRLGLTITLCSFSLAQEQARDFCMHFLWEDNFVMLEKMRTWFWIILNFKLLLFTVSDWETSREGHQICRIIIWMEIDISCDNLPISALKPRSKILRGDDKFHIEAVISPVRLQFERTSTSRNELVLWEGL